MAPTTYNISTGIPSDLASTNSTISSVSNTKVSRVVEGRHIRLGRAASVIADDDRGPEDGPHLIGGVSVNVDVYRERKALSGDTSQMHTPVSLLSLGQTRA